MCPKFVKPIQFFIILTIFEWFTCWQRRLTQFSFACFILITIRNIYESSLSQFYCPWIFSVSTYMLQNIKETASLKWNNHFEGVAVANPHYQHFEDALFYKPDVLCNLLKDNIEAFISHVKNIPWEAFRIVNTLKGNLPEK